MAVVIDWKLVSEKDRWKLNRLKVKEKIIKKKYSQLIVWSKIHYISSKETWYRLYEWKILEFLNNDQVKVLVMSRYIHDSNDLIEQIVDKNRLSLDKK